LSRFLLLAITLQILVMALFEFALEARGLKPSPGALLGRPVVVPDLPGQVVLGTWLLQALALTGLFLLVRGKLATWWLEGLATGWLAWLFRGPLLVLTVVGGLRLPHGPWWSLALGWWLLYSVCGLLTARLYRSVGRDRRPQPR
jgi:hypothetical protein